MGDGLIFDFPRCNRGAGFAGADRTYATATEK